jgi:hypothetical protein
LENEKIKLKEILNKLIIKNYEIFESYVSFLIKNLYDENLSENERFKSFNLL